MMIARVVRLTGLGLLALVLAAAFSAVAASNTVPESGLGVDSPTYPVTANQLRPQECIDAGQNLADVLFGSSSGGNTRSLILGTGGNDNVRGRGGDDCIAGGSGSDTLDSDNGYDVILGGPGNDTLIGNGGNDRLYGGSGRDWLYGDQGNDFLSGGPDVEYTCDGGGGSDTTDGSCENLVSIP